MEKYDLAIIGPELISLGEIGNDSMVIVGKNLEIEDAGSSPSIRNLDFSRFNLRFSFFANYGIRDSSIACLDVRN